MNLNIIWILIAVWILYEITKGIDLHLKSRRVLTIEQMADNLEKGLWIDGKKATLSDLEQKVKSGEWQFEKSRLEDALRHLDKQASGEIPTRSKNLAKPKKKRPIKLF